MKKVALFMAAALHLSFLAFNITPVLAHEELVVGDISIVAGWVNEPPMVNQLNGALLIITQVSNSQPVNNALAQADVTLQKGTETKPLELLPAEEPGTYTATLIPTQTGPYTVVIRGTISGQTIDAQIDIEDVEDTTRFTFPLSSTTTTTTTATAGSSNNQLPQGFIDQLQLVISDLTTQIEEASIAAQEANNSTQSVAESIEGLKVSADRAYLFGLIGVGVGTAGIAIGVVALSRREKV
jgi:hypothetical protein